jgi:hypothetical protein
MNDQNQIELPDEVMDRMIFEHSHGILIELLKKNTDLMEDVTWIVYEFLKDVDEDDIKNELFCILDNINAEDVIENSGPSEFGCEVITELALEMFGEEVGPFVAQARKYHEIGMMEERDIYFRGILRGLHRYYEESNSNFRELTPDAPEETFEGVVEEWKELSKDPEMVDEYVDANFEGWLKK